MNIKRSIGKRIDKLLKSFGLEKIKKIDPIIPNLYGTDFKKTVLISYITEPFRNQNHFKHQNYITSHIVAESFRELGYNVDVISFREDQLILDYKKYAVVFGFGVSFERLFFTPERQIPRIHFITGAHRDLHNEMGLKSLIDFQKISGSWLPAEANISTDVDYLSYYNADSSVILAQGYILEDLQSRFTNKIYSLKNNILGTFSHFEPKTVRRPDFLFLSGSYLITKGLCLLLELAKIRKDLNFYIVIPYLNKELETYYHEVLKDDSHVFLYQNIRMDSSEMKSIIERCSYSISPSYIDGLPGGTIEPMSSGLVPIVSKYCGFERKDFIFEIEELSVEGLSATVEAALKLDDTTYFEYSQAVRNYTQKYFSPASVKAEFKKILTDAIQD